MGKLLLLIILVAGIFGGYVFVTEPQKPPAVNKTITYDLKSGTSVTRLANDLKEKQVIKSAWAFRLWSRIKGYDAKLKAGEYLIKSEDGIEGILQKIVSGKSIQHTITFLEGWTFKDYLAALAKHKKLTHTLSNKSKKQIMTLLGKPGRHPEGWFYPDTYAFKKDSKDIDILKKSMIKTERVLKEEWEKRSKDTLAKTPYEALILASIIEKETNLDRERREISGVFTRRIKIGMRLQTDPTVIYGLGDRYKGNIKRKHLREKTPYNTYVIYGLPPTPIAMPSQASINAALHPDKGKTLYFVSKGDGSHYFSKTLKEHNAAVNKYILKR